MDENKPTGQSPVTVNPAAAEQLEQIKRAVPDTSQRLFEFLVANLKPIAVGCAGIVLAAGVYAGVNHWREAQVAKAADKLGVILIDKDDAAARTQALEEFLKDAPSGLKPTAELELAAAATLAKQYDKAIAAWTSLEGSSSADMRIIAGIGHARCLLLSGKAQDALAKLNALKPQAPEAYAQAVTRQIAVAAEAAGDAKTAAGAYAELAQKADGASKPFFEFKANQLQPKS